MSATGGGSLLGVSVLELRTDQGPLNRGLAQARMSSERTGAQMQATMDRRMVSMGASMSRVGSSMSRYLTVPILALGGAAADFSVKFQQAMEMIHTQAGASQAEVNKLKVEVLALAGVLPQSPQELARGLFHLESIGLRGAKAMNALKIAAEGAAVGNADLEQTATALGSAWLVNIKGAGDLHKVMGILNATVGAGNMTMQSLVDSLGTGVLPAAKIAGLGIKDVMGALAVFTDEGYQGSSAAAQLATALHYLYDPTSKATKALNAIGMSGSQMATDMHKPNGLLIALTDLKDHLDKLPGGMKGVPAEQVLGSIFPGGRGRVLLTLLNQLDRYGMKLRQIQKNTDSFSQDVAATQKTNAYKIHAAWSLIQADLIGIGDKVLPELLSVGKDAVGLADKAATAFGKLPKGVQDAIITGGLITAGIGPALKILGVFTSGIGRLLTVARVAEKLARTPLTRQGLGGVFGGRTSGLSQTVATMEVAELIVKSMVGGGGLPGERGGSRFTPAPYSSSTSGMSPGTLTADEQAAKEAEAAAAGTTLTLGKLVPVLGGLAVGAKGLYDAFNGSGGGLEGGIERFLKGTIGMVLPAGAFPGPNPGSPLNQALDYVRSKGAGGSLSSPDINALAVYINKFDQLKGDVSKLTPKALVELKVEGEKLARDPALAQYRGTVLAVMRSLANVADTAKGQGAKIAHGLEQGWNKYRFGSEPMMLQQLTARIKNLPPSMKAGAIQSAIAFAQGLQSKGRLPAGAWQLMLAQINRLFPGWQKSLGAAAALSAATFTKQLDLTKAEQNTRDTLGKISHDFPEVSHAMETTKGDVIAKSVAVIRALKSIDTTGSAPMTAAVIADIKKLRQSVSADLGKMVAVSASSAKDMSHNIQHGSAFAAQAAETNFGRVASAVGRAMNSGLLSAQQGAKLIGQALNAMLVAFGQKPIPLAGFSAQQIVSWQKWWQQGSSGGTAGHGHHATGGMVQIGRAGAAGRDTVPLNMGGVPIMVGEGETPMVLTRHQRPILESWAREKGYAGLPGFFQRVKRPNYMASGGIVTASEFGGPGDPGTGSVGYRGDNLYQHPDSYAELNMGTALGGLPYMTPLDITRGSRTARAYKRDIGAGGPGMNGHVRAIDLWFQLAQALGVNGLADVLINGGRGVNVRIAGAPGMSQIPVPKITGTGTIADIVRAALGIEAKGANQYLGTHMPSVNVGLAGMMGGKPVGHGAFAGLTLGRTDQGVDFGGAGPVEAVLAGQVLRNTIWPGWPGTGGIVYRTGRGNVYVMEDFAAAMRVGQRVGQGQVIGQATGGGSGIEAGWANAAGTGPLTPYNGRPDGTPMPGGIDFRHFLGFARGGMLNRLMAGGGMIGPGIGVKDPLGHGTGHHSPHNKTVWSEWSKHRPAHHKSVWSETSKHRPAILPLSLANPRIERGLGIVNSLLGQRGEVAKFREVYQHIGDFFDLAHPNLNYVVTQDKLGNQVSPYIDEVLGRDGFPIPDIHSKHAVNASLGELVQLHTYQYGIVHDQERAMKLIPRLLRWIHDAIEKRRRHVERLKQKIEENLRRIRKLRDAQTKPDPKVLALRKAINTAGQGSSVASIKSAIANAEGIYVQPGKAGDSARAARDKLVAGLRAKLVLAENGQRGDLTSLRNDLLGVEAHDSARKRQIGIRIGNVEQQNSKLGGSTTTVGSGGMIGTLGKEISALAGSASNLLGDQLSTVGASGLGGSLESDKLQLATLNQQISQLSPRALQQQLKVARASFTSQNDQALIADLTAKLTQDASTIAIEKAEIKVLGQPLQLGPLPAFGGSFSRGGVVPGAIGEPRTIIAHGGERVTPPGEGADVRVVVEDHRVRVWVDDVEKIVDSRMRSTSRNAGRPLPGRGGGNQWLTRR